MKITVVTVCRNAVSTIEDAIHSVACQTYEDVEHIVIDGASRDGTLSLIRENEANISKWVSEPDNGIYDAMNKGIALATGDVIGLLNADDFYPDNTILELVAGCFSEVGVDVVYGDLCYVKKDSPTDIVRYWRSSEYRPGKFEQGWCLPHPTFFLRREIYQQQGGGYDTDFRLASDFELIVRCLSKKRLHSRYLPKVLVKMRLGGVTNKNISNIINQNREILLALKKNGLRTSIFRFGVGKLLSRARQFIIRPSP